LQVSQKPYQKKLHDRFTVNPDNSFVVQPNQVKSVLLAFKKPIILSRIRILFLLCFLFVTFLSETQNRSIESAIVANPDTLSRETYPFYLVQTLYSSEYLIWTNHLSMAQKFADSIGFLQRTTGIESSRELSDALENYRRLIDQYICWNADEDKEIDERDHPSLNNQLPYFSMIPRFEFIEVNS
jgi:hypothetical protein